MSGHRPFSELKKNWTPERRAANTERKAKLADEMVTLEQLRERLGISQEELAGILDVHQPAISKLVRRPDMNLSDQLTHLMSAQRAYQLNVAVFERARDSYAKALEIGK